MKAVCAYYKNVRRLGLVAERIALAQDVNLYALQGTVIRSPKSVSFLGENISALVIGKPEDCPILLTNMPQYENSNGQVVDVAVDRRDNIFTQVLSVCQYKYNVGKNPFTMSCSVKGCTLVVSPTDSGALSYVMRGPSGDIVTESKEVQRDLLMQCTGIKAFQYHVVTDTCEKEVTIKRAQAEIFREIAHYVNKTLILSKFDGSTTRDLCISSTGCCEFSTVISGEIAQSRVAKVPFTRVKLDLSSSLTVVECGLDVLLRHKTISQALRGANIR